MKISPPSSLLISIPCYRRPHLLFRLLNSIADAEFGKEIGVALCDDSPGRENETVYREALELGLSIRYFHNSSRLGIDANIQHCMSLQGFKYIWLMGEDDMITPNGISLVLNELRGSPSLIFANYAQVSDDGLSRPGLPPDVLNVSSKQDYVDKLLIRFGFLGSVVFKPSPQPIASYLFLSSYFAHIGYLIQIIDRSKSDELRFIPAACSINRVGGLDTFSWGSDAIRVYTGFYRLLTHIQSAAPPKTFSLDYPILRSKETFYPLHKITRVIRLKSAGLLTFREALRLYFTYGGNIICLLAAALPRPLASSITYTAMRIIPQYRILK